MKNRFKILDTFQDFSTYWRYARTKSVEEQIRLWQNLYMNKYPELLDKQRLHRIHALGLEHKNRGFLIVLPAGGGKTTLAMSVLQSPNKNIRLISEESPLVRSDGTLLPFPLRIGVVPENLPSGIDAQFTRQIKRMEFSSKVTIDINDCRDTHSPLPSFF